MCCACRYHENRFQFREPLLGRRRIYSEDHWFFFYPLIRRIQIAVLVFCGVFILISEPGFAFAACIVADPTGTPLPVRDSPRGKKKSILINGTAVEIQETTPDDRGLPWARIRQGWVYANFLNCRRSTTASPGTAGASAADGGSTRIERPIGQPKEGPSRKDTIESINILYTSQLYCADDFGNNRYKDYHDFGFSADGQNVYFASKLGSNIPGPFLLWAGEFNPADIATFSKTQQGGHFSLIVNCRPGQYCIKDRSSAVNTGNYEIFFCKADVLNRVANALSWLRQTSKPSKVLPF